MGGGQPSKVSLKPIGAMGNKIKCLFVDDAVLFADNEYELQRVLDEFYSTVLYEKEAKYEC